MALLEYNAADTNNESAKVLANDRPDALPEFDQGNILMMLSPRGLGDGDHDAGLV